MLVFLPSLLILNRDPCCVVSAVISSASSAGAPILLPLFPLLGPEVELILKQIKNF
jgi:hypothetical protein